MKTKLLLIFALGLTILQSEAQIVNGNLSPDWTITDINGVSQNLYSYLNAGKTVFIDISTTWCGPCWGYHNSGAYDSLWNLHGPIGAPSVSPGTTNDIMLFLIEADGTTTNADLHGVGAPNGNTLGDWVTGTNYPIIDPTYTTTPSVYDFNAIYNVSYYPTCVMICPDRSMTNVPQYTAAQMMNSKSACSIAATPLDAKMMVIASNDLIPTFETCDSAAVVVQIANAGTSTLTSATITYLVDGVTQKVKNWIGNVVTYDNVAVPGVLVGSSLPGTHTIQAIVSNPNGGIDSNVSNDSTAARLIIYSAVGGLPVGESFESGGIPANWFIKNGRTATDMQPETWSNGGWASTGFNSAKSAVLRWLYIWGDVRQDLLTIPAISFTGITAPSMTFDVACAPLSPAYGYAASTNELRVQVSSDCGTAWATVYSKVGPTLATAPPTAISQEFIPATPALWRHETVDLSAYSGQASVIIRFNGVSPGDATMNDLYIDNVNFQTSSAGISENLIVNNINVYPNPSSGSFVLKVENINSNERTNIKVIDIYGRNVYNSSEIPVNGNVLKHIDLSSFAKGIYTVQFTTENAVVSKILVIE